MNVALILSGGNGSRFGSGIPKQYQLLAGKSVIAHSIDVLKATPCIEAIVVAAGVKYMAKLEENHSVAVITSGDSRNETLRNGIEYIKANFPLCEKVFINEAARPLITATMVDEYIQLLDEYDAVITAQHITDSLGKEGEAVTDRSLYYLIQAPEAFRFKLLYKNFQAESSITATSQQLPPNSHIYKNFNFRRNIKITYPEDLIFAEQLMRCDVDTVGCDGFRRNFNTAQEQTGYRLS